MRLHPLLLAAFFPALLAANLRGFHRVIPTKPWVQQDPANGWVPASVPEGGLICLMGDYRTLLAGTGSGIYRSMDRALTWTRVADVGQVNWISRHDSDYFAGTSSALLLSTDGGETWRAILDAGIPSQAVARIDDRLFAGVRGIGMFRTMGAGGKWKEAPASPENRVILCLASVEDSVLLAGGPWGVYRSVDYSRHWSLPDQGLGQPVLQLHGVPDGTAYAMTEKREIHVSEDGGRTWSRDQAGLDTVEVRSLASIAGLAFATGKGGVYRRKKGYGWGRIPGLEAETITCLTFLNGDLFAGAPDRLFMKKNAPFARTTLSSPPPERPVLPLPGGPEP